MPSGTLTTAAPIPLSSPASFGNGVHAKITSIKAVNAPARGIGEIAGPGVRIAIAISNDTAKSISLDEISITIENAQKNPGVQMSASRPAQGTLAARRTAHGVYVFTIPKAHRNPLTVNMSYSVKTPVVLFVGTVR
ncbi:hypothetical protein [uncultured Jatrophihabitans sp.]|uniref:hypothetical protein n=1 Tax=uncultured Jatrophihabitans sp. TaxID=1610747 RepID=UPI0035CC93AF